LKKIIKFGNIFDITIDALFSNSFIKKSKSFYLDSFNNKINKSSKASFGNFYLEIDKEKQEEELINLNNSDEFKNDFMNEKKNFNNFNFSQQSHNESSACKNINNLSENKRVFGNSNFDYENENEENNINSSIFSNNVKIKKSNSTNILGEIENKISYDPELFTTENNNLEKIFHSPNFYNFNQNFSKDNNNFEEDNNINYNKIFKKNSFSNTNLKKLENYLNCQFQKSQEKYIGLLKVEEEESKNQNKLENLNLKTTSNIKNKKFIMDKRNFDESTSAYSDMQNNIPSYTPNPDFSREIQSNNLINKNKNSFLYPNYSDFSDALNIPNIKSSSSSNQNVNPYSKRNFNNLNNNNKINDNEIIYEHQNDYENDNYGMSNFEVNDRKKDLYGDFEGENLINNFLNDEITYTPKRRDKNDESFDNRNYETFDCCNIDNFINPIANINNTSKAGFNSTNINKNSEKRIQEDTILKVSENNFNNSNNINKNLLSNRLNEIIEKKFPVSNNDFVNPKNPFSLYNQKLKSENLATSTNKKPALNINDDMCFYPKSIRNGIPSRNNLSNNKFEEFSNETINKINTSNKNESLYNIIDNFKNFTNLSENNLSNANRNPMNAFMNLNNLDLENNNNSINNSNKNSANNFNNKIDLQSALNKKEENSFSIVNNNNQKQQKLANQNNIIEKIEESTSNDNFINNTFFNQNKTQNLNTHSVNKLINQGSNIQVGEKQSKQVNPNSQNKTGWVCSQCKNFNYESNNH